MTAGRRLIGGRERWEIGKVNIENKDMMASKRLIEASLMMLAANTNRELVCK
jgi:hypothetical protein